MVSPLVAFLWRRVNVMPRKASNLHSVTGAGHLKKHRRAIYVIRVKKKKKKRNVISKKSDFMAKSLDIKSISQTVLRLPVMWIFTGMPNGTSPTVLPLRSELGFPSVNFSTRYCKTKRLVGVRNLDQKENALSSKIYILNRYYDE